MAWAGRAVVRREHCGSSGVCLFGGEGEREAGLGGVHFGEEFGEGAELLLVRLARRQARLELRRRAKQLGKVLELGGDTHQGARERRRRTG